MRKQFGKCAICGKLADLTFEHIPPEAAFNSAPAKPVVGLEVFTKFDDRLPWDVTGLKYQNQQRGVGRYSLCSECNNNTGAWYGSDYSSFANVIATSLQKFSRNEPKQLTVDIYPARIIKQALSMFCSVLPINAQRYTDIRNYVINKDAVGIDKNKYKLCMFFTKSPIISFNGPMVVGSFPELEKMRSMCKIVAYPLGFLLYFDPNPSWQHQGFDITYFSDYGYNDRTTITMPWILKEVNGRFPEDYRTKEEIIACRNEVKQLNKTDLND